MSIKYNRQRKVRFVFSIAWQHLTLDPTHVSSAKLKCTPTNFTQDSDFPQLGSVPLGFCTDI